MIDNYAMLSLETHLFFARIMKEHSLFLEAGFPCKDEEWIKRADWFRQQFEELLDEVTRLADGRVGRNILRSEELVTECTIPAEKRTESLSGIPIDSRITTMQKGLRPGRGGENNRELNRRVHRMNEHALRLVKELIDFKEKILCEVGDARLFTTNYPLLIKHIQREARLYCVTIEDLMANRRCSRQSLRETEEFWNQIMMEHAQFIRGLLDPTECKLIDTADCFAQEFKKLLALTKEQDCNASEELTRRTIEETKKLRDFKAAGTEGILDCKIASVILPLLGDHVLREANHYLRILEEEN